MAADKFLYNNGGDVTEKAGATTAVGNAIPALDATGRLAVAQLPVGVGPETKDMPTSETLAAGDFVNVFNDTGTLKARKADASNTAKQADGMVLAGFTHPTTATVYLLGGNNNTAKSAMTIGARQWLSATTPGGTVEAAETYAAGARIHQLLGKALSATEMDTQTQPVIVLAS